MNPVSLFQIRVVSEFDIHVTVPLFGFSSLDEYYRASCNSDKIHKIQTPLICINATDDPFVPKECMSRISSYNYETPTYG